jgi:hypothetical protein
MEAKPLTLEPAAPPQELVFVLAVRPETAAAPWRARVLYAEGAEPRAFETPLDLVRHLAQVSDHATHASTPPPRRGGLR